MLERHQVGRARDGIPLHEAVQDNKAQRLSCDIDLLDS